MKRKYRSSPPSDAGRTCSWRCTGHWHRWSILVVVLLLVETCTADDDGCNNGNGPNYYSYTVESVQYNPATDRVTVVGLYAPVGYMRECLLPTAEVRHGFQLGEEGWVTFEAATPLGDEYQIRRSAARAAQPVGVELAIPGRGTITVRHRDEQWASWTALVVPCSHAVLKAEDGSWYRAMELRCGYCVEHGCGNDICDPGEDWYDCNWDCPPPVTVCGDGTCDGTEMGVCREDCGCTNAQCDEQCTGDPGNTDDYGYCGATDVARWYGCGCGGYIVRCNGTEPSCNSNDALFDEVIFCDQAVGYQAIRGCNQLCWEAYGTYGGYCDVDGTDDCVCEGGITPW